MTLKRMTARCVLKIGELRYDKREINASLFVRGELGGVQ